MHAHSPTTHEQKRTQTLHELQRNACSSSFLQLNLITCRVLLSLRSCSCSWLLVSTVAIMHVDKSCPPQADCLWGGESLPCLMHAWKGGGVPRFVFMQEEHASCRINESDPQERVHPSQANIFASSFPCKAWYFCILCPGFPCERRENQRTQPDSSDRTQSSQPEAKSHCKQNVVWTPLWHETCIKWFIKSCHEKIHEIIDKISYFRPVTPGGRSNDHGALFGLPIARQGRTADSLQNYASHTLAMVFHFLKTYWPI